MNLLNYPMFFSGVMKCFALHSNFYKKTIRHGLEPKNWPDCEAKFMASDFHELVLKKSYEYAALAFREKALALESFEMPEDLNTLLCVYNEYREFGLFRELGLKLSSDPKRGREILHCFNNQTPSNIKTISFQEKIGGYIENQVMLKNEKQKSHISINDWELLSKSIGGFNPGRVVMIIAGTGVGKTTLALNLSLSAIKTMPVLYFNMEMTIDDILDRSISMGAGLTQEQWSDPSTSLIVEKAANFVSGVYGGSDLIVTDGRALTIEQITAEIYNQKETKGIKLVFVDYDQKIRTKFSGEEWQTVQRAVEELEEVAKATETCILVLSQGDDQNLPKASKRAMQPASAVLAFFKDDSGEFFIESKKNRFGPQFKISVMTDFKMYQIKEAGFFNPNNAIRKVDRSLFANPKK